MGPALPIYPAHAHGPSLFRSLIWSFSSVYISSWSSSLSLSPTRQAATATTTTVDCRTPLDPFVAIAFTSRFGISAFAIALPSSHRRWCMPPSSCALGPAARCYCSRTPLSSRSRSSRAPASVPGSPSRPWPPAPPWSSPSWPPEWEVNTYDRDEGIQDADGRRSTVVVVRACLVAERPEEDDELNDRSGIWTVMDHGHGLDMGRTGPIRGPRKIN